MKFKTIFNFIFITFSALILFTSCRDLDQEIQDKRTVVLNMDFQKRSSSRNSPNISSSELNQYNTHLIVAVPSSEQLNSNYLSYYYSAFYADLMSPQDRRVSMEIPMNTDLKVFAFLFRGNYSLNDLYLFREVGAYGQSGSFRINNQTNNISLGISLQSTNNSSTAATNAYSIEEVTPIGTTSDSTPNYTFASTIAGTITYGGSCSSSTTSATEGNNTITLSFLSNGTYSNCSIKITDSSGNESNTLTINIFTINDTTLLAYYSFEGNLNDTSSNNRHLTENTGSEITYTSNDNQSNKSGKAAWFNGTNSHAYTDNITIGDNFTISFWTRPDINSMVNWDSIMSTGDVNTGNQIQIDYDGNGKLRFSSTGSNISLGIVNNEWQHFVFTKNTDSIDNKKIRLYKNGEYIDAISNLNTRWDKLKIGINRGGSRFWKGLVDEFIIYNRALSAIEINSLYQSY